MRTEKHSFDVQLIALLHGWPKLTNRQIAQIVNKSPKTVQRAQARLAPLVIEAQRKATEYLSEVSHA